MTQGTLSLNFKLITYLLLLHLFITLLIYPTITSADLLIPPLPPIGDLVCNTKLINCGEGACKASNATALGFECECNPGWKAIQVGPLTFPSCVVPNCTINFQCDASASPPPPPIPPPPPPPPPPGCALVWCGDGNCKAINGSGYECECNKGSFNLLDLPTLACFKPCFLGGDCKSKGFQSPQPSNANLSHGNISFTIVLLIAIFLTWIGRGSI